MNLELFTFVDELPDVVHQAIAEIETLEGQVPFEKDAFGAIKNSGYLSVLKHGKPIFGAFVGDLNEKKQTIHQIDSFAALNETKTDMYAPYCYTKPHDENTHAVSIRYDGVKFSLSGFGKERGVFIINYLAEHYALLPKSEELVEEVFELH